MDKPNPKTATVGKLYRVYVPPEYREFLGLKIGDELVFRTDREGHVCIEKLK